MPLHVSGSVCGHLDVYKRQGLELLLEAKKATGLPVVTEIMDASHLPLFEDRCV